MPNIGDNWVCRYCGHAQVISKERYSTSTDYFYKDGWTEGKALVIPELTICANQRCAKLTFRVILLTWDWKNQEQKIVKTVAFWNLLPASAAKPQPDYIPEPIRKDYEEACAIRDLSPKASATLIRRCIQGIIRDFCGISGRRLVDEIAQLRKQVDEGKAPPGVQPDTVAAIDNVREIGNIGAHMEADINLIVDVDPNEAELLIGLTELLFAEWYVARQARQERLAALEAVAVAKGKKSKPAALQLPKSEASDRPPNQVLGDDNRTL